MKLIPLSQKGKHAGKYFAQVDDEDYEWLTERSWSALIVKRCGKQVIYARRGTKIGQGKARTIYMHSNILLHHGLVSKNDRDVMIDHKDHNGLNNQKENLRQCTNEQNLRNRKKVSKITKGSKYIGVRMNKWGRWIASVTYKGKHYTQTAATEVDAARIRNKMVMELHGEFAMLNVIS